MGWLRFACPRQPASHPSTCRSALSSPAACHPLSHPACLPPCRCACLPPCLPTLLACLCREQEERETRKEQGLPPPREEGPGGERGSFDSGDPYTTNLFVGNVAPDVDEQVGGWVQALGVPVCLPDWLPSCWCDSIDSRILTHYSVLVAHM
jgi:hypothetical protein